MLASKISDRTIDSSLPFIPERVTSLAYTPIYLQLSDRERLRYNQCYALYMNEKTAFLEEELTDFMVAVANLECARSLRGDLLRLVLDEERHASEFRALNRRAASDLYAKGGNVFVRPTRAQHRLRKTLTRAPRMFPFLLWIILLFEERSLYYTALYTEECDSLEPSFVRLHQSHAQDERSHVAVDDALIEILWAARPMPLRRLNVFVLRQVFAEFLYYPKRAAVEILNVSFPGHPLLCEMTRQVIDLRHNADFLRSLYNQRTNPHTLATMERFAELEPLLATMEGRHS